MEDHPHFNCPLLYLPLQPSASPTQPAVPPAQPVVPPLQAGQVPRSNWSHFKPEFAGKPDETEEAYLLRTNDWMAPMHFKRLSKSKDFV